MRSWRPAPTRPCRSPMCAPLADASEHDLSFLDNRKYAIHLTHTRAAACLVAPAFAANVPKGTSPLITAEPYRGFALALQLFYPDAMQPKAAMAGGGAFVHPTAQLEEGVVVEPGAVVGAEARIGRGTRIAAGAVIGYRVSIGRDSYIGPLATLVHTPGRRPGNRALGRAHRPGRVRLRHGRRGPSQGAADRPGHHPG